MLKKKLARILENANFRTNLFTLIVSFLYALYPESVEPETALATVIGMNTYNPLVKIFKEKPEPFLSSFTSSNFYTNLFSALFAMAAFFGIQIPDGTAEGIWNFIGDKEWGFLISLIAINIYNPIAHFIRDRRRQKIPDGDDNEDPES